MAKKGRSVKGAFGTITHYDEHGKKIGTSRPSVFGNGYNHYDTKGKRTGYSNKNALGNGYTHHTVGGKKTGRSDKNVLGGYNHYDCPQVWTLRRFRDGTLARHSAGRAFIRAYYALSPTAVRLFGETRWFKGLWRGVLDGFVRRLNKSGVEDTPYKDKNYR